MTASIYLQARMNSTRLPEKALMKIGEKTVTSILIDRLKRVRNVDRIVLVTGKKLANQPLIDEAARLQIEYFQGDEENLLDRFYQASRVFPADAIVRVTGDCPLIDPDLVEHAIRISENGNYSMVSNARVRTYPDGMDVEVFSLDALRRAWECNVGDSRDLSGVFINPTKFIHQDDSLRKYDLIHTPDWGEVRVTLDFPEDFEVIREIYTSCRQHDEYFGVNDIVAFLIDHPDVAALNKKHVCLDYGL